MLKNKSLSIITAAIFAFMGSLMMSSCMDEDDQASYYLSGQWAGDMGMYYTDGYWEYYAYKTEIEFIPDYDYATHGYGRQVDFYRDGYYPTMHYFFYWNVSNGVISLFYPDAPELNVNIYDYSLYNDYFSGRIGNTSFRLYKIYDFYWDDNWGYDYDYGYWSKSRNAETDSIATDTLKIRRGCKFNEPAVQEPQ